MADTSVAIYARSRSAVELSNQVETLRAYCQGRGWSHPVEYIEALDTMPNDAENQPQFGRLVDDILAGRIQTIIVRSLDRLFRDVKEADNTLQHWKNIGVQLVVLED